MVVPMIFGKPITVWLGMLLFILLIFQMLTGKRILKLPFVYHKVNAIVLTLVASVHALLGIGIWFFGFTIG